jgi:hypothetical protein
MGEVIDVLGHLVFNRCLQKPSGSFPDNLFQNGFGCFFSLLSVLNAFIILHGRILPPLLATGDR